jgi:hypothetical protein
MKACGVTGLFFAVCALCALGFAACGGGAAEAPAPAAPSGGATLPGAEPNGGGDMPDTPSPASATPPPADSAATPAEPPADLGEGDSRTTESIVAVVKTHRKEARDCYEKALKQTPGLKGDLVIHFTLKPSGEVKQAELNEERSTIRQAMVSTCVIGVIRAIAFPKSSKGLETTVNYPFNFNP